MPHANKETVNFIPTIKLDIKLDSDSPFISYIQAISIMSGFFKINDQYI